MACDGTGSNEKKKSLKALHVAKGMKKKSRLWNERLSLQVE